MSDKLEISKRHFTKANDGHKTFSIRLRKDIFYKIDKIAYQTNRSKNEIINIILEYGIEHYIISD